PEYTSGNIQGQLDEKQKKYPALDEIGQLEPEDYDVLMWMSDPGDWSLVTEESDRKIKANRVQFGEYFINDAGDPGEMWMWKLQDPQSELQPDPNQANYNPARGEWAAGADITGVHTDDPVRGGLIITGDENQDGIVEEDNDGYAGDIYITVNAGTDIHQIVQLVDGGAGSGSLPIVDGSQLTGLRANQLNDASVLDVEFDLLAGLRVTDHPNFTSGYVQGQLDDKLNYNAALDDIAHLNPGDSDVLMWMSNVEDEIDGGNWALVADDSHEITKSRIELGQFFITSAGGTGEIWMSQGSQEGVWAETGPHINSSYNEEEAEGTLELNVYPEDGGKVIVANDDNMLPVVNGSQLHGINATQINSTVEDPGLVSNDQFDLLQDLRTGP
ncbi:uncharacterized protein METZ01_LOCUS300093, partial [marine metagenome]